MTCPECGATDCTAACHACLAADFSDEGYGVVHHLVAFVLDHLDRPPSDHDRRMIHQSSDEPVRVRTRETQGQSPEWDTSVGDVDLGSADTYVATVRAWARSVAEALQDAGVADEGHP